MSLSASNVNGVPVEIGNRGIQGPLEVNVNRSSTNFLHFPHFNAQYYNLPYLSPPVHGVRSGNGNLAVHPRALTLFDSAPPRSVSHPGSSEPTGIRINWPHNTAIVSENINPRHHNAPHFRVSAIDVKISPVVTFHCQYSDLLLS